MDYLDPKKQSRSNAMLFVGYVLVAIAISIATIILLYTAYGFGIGKNGTVIQSGWAFFSSQPHPAQIRVNGQLASATTNTRLSLQDGIYNITLSRTGYRDWHRSIELQGGDVEHFDYPVLFPVKLTNKKLHPYPSAPGLVTQSPDRRWLVVQQPSSMTNFDLFDLKNPAKSQTPTSLSLPTTILSKPTTPGESWQLEEWADDNRHLVLQHTYDGKTEYILVDRTNPAQSLNLNTTLAANPAKLTLNNKKYDQYYLYAADGNLQTATLSKPAPAAVLQHVLAYQSYGSSTLLYATSSGAPAGKVLVKLLIGGQTYVIHSFPAGTNYLLDLTTYSGTLYVAAGAGAENKVYIYADPVGQYGAAPHQALVPSQVLHLDGPNYLSFSTNAQFIVAEAGTQFGIYDIENQKGYTYTVVQPLDPPQAHATWMDGDRLDYVSGGKLSVFDYDNANRQTLVKAGSAYLPAFAPDYKYVYLVAPSDTPGQFDLTQTPLLTPADL